MKVISSVKAFSLVELLIAVAITSILFAISVISFSKLRANVCLREAARTISSDIQLCKTRAVSESVRYRIIIQMECNNYIIQKESSPGYWTNVSSVKNIGEQDDAVKIVKDPTYGGDMIIFQPRGTTNAGTLEIQHAKFLSTAKIVTSLTGRVRIKYDLK